MQPGGQDEYDLEGVTARLEAMQARRRRWHGRVNECPGKLQLPEREVAEKFDLAPADLSSGDDSDDDHRSSSMSSLPSDDGIAVSQLHQSETNKRQAGRGRAPRARVTDSLDLSMSVSTPGQGYPSPPHAKEANCSSSNQRLTHSRLPGEESVQLLQGSLQQKVLDRAAAGEDRTGNAFCKTSRIPKLVQQRRQLHASTQHAEATVNFKSRVLAPPSVANDSFPAENKPHGNSPPLEECSSIFESSKQVTSLHSIQSPARGLPKSKHSAKVRANNTDGVTEADFTTAEERQLLQSLEKLNRRLTKVSTPSATVREGGPLCARRERVLITDSSLSDINTESTNTTCITNSEIDEEALRAAAYGGGTHCKLRQPSSVSVRSSSARRAELSTGVHKARVRVGGACIQDTGRNGSTDQSGKHKIVVKKELAHLLF